MTWLLGTRLGRYALLAAVGASVVLLAVLYLDSRAKRLAAIERLQSALRAAQARKEAQDAVDGMSRTERDDALARWMRD